MRECRRDRVGGRTGGDLEARVRAVQEGRGNSFSPRSEPAGGRVHISGTHVLSANMPLPMVQYQYRDVTHSDMSSEKTSDMTLSSKRSFSSTCRSGIS